MSRIYDATWGRFFSAVYDGLMKSTEEAGMREIRREALSQARGRTIDIGAGTGINVELYPEAITELLLAEPDEHMLNRLRPKVPGWGREVSVVQAPADGLPYDDDSFDTAVFTLVLCTVPDPPAALREAARVLKPGGKLLFVEHVRSEDPGLARWQDRLEGPWRFLGDGCHCNRDTVANIEASPFEVEKVVKGELPKSPPLVRPLVHGQATLAA
ncbi:MAG TPA: class I SAM-dependent methyltransferase [Solirubrobacterales bacterium]